MESYIEENTLYKFANQRFLSECEYLHIAEQNVDESIKQGTLTAAKLGALIECRFNVREASHAQLEAIQQAIMENARKTRPIVKKPLWRRLLKK